VDYSELLELTVTFELDGEERVLQRPKPDGGTYSSMGLPLPNRSIAIPCRDQITGSTRHVSYT
jgi:hypothetical protein